jgi:hypothetical protein
MLPVVAFISTVGIFASVAIGPTTKPCGLRVMQFLEERFAALDLLTDGGAVAGEGEDVANFDRGVGVGLGGAEQGGEQNTADQRRWQSDHAAPFR